MSEFVKNEQDHRYSRQSYAIGQEAQLKLTESNVLVIGYNSLAQEIIRNLALIGVKSIKIFSNVTLQNHHLTNLYYSVNDGIPISELSKLNPSTQIEITNVLDENGEMNFNEFKKYNSVILTNCSIDDAIAINRITHKLSIPFVMCGSYGLVGFTFNDFGDNFVVTDIDGEQSEQLVLESIESKILKFKDPHKLSDGDTLNVSWDDGTISQYHVYRKKSPIMIELTEIPEQDKNKYIKILRDKISKTFGFEQLKKNLESITYGIADWSVPIERTPFLHKLHMGMDKYLNEFGCLPRAWSITDWEVFEKYFQFESEQEILLARKFCYTSQGDLTPISSIIGGIVTHEILKAITHKFIPITQWHYMDYLDLISDNEIKYHNTICDSNYKTKTKYEGIVNVFGKTFLETFQSTIPFVVGSGAIGCELIKNLGMMGVKQIYLTDPDYIEKSNLSRQFLFNDNDIRHSKAETAGRKIKQMNPDTNVVVFKQKMCVDTENIFDNAFHSDINVYLNALDNVDARTYMDSLAIKYSKPLIDSGTLGSKGNVQVILPHLTETYASSKDPEENTGIPICTIKSFPYKPEHTIQWARELFETEFNQIPTLLNKYKNYIELEKLNDLESKNLLKQLHKYDGFELNSKGFLKILLTIFYENHYLNVKEILSEHAKANPNPNPNPNTDINTNPSTEITETTETTETTEKLKDKKMPIFLTNSNLSLSDFEQYIQNGFMVLNQIFNTDIVMDIVSDKLSVQNLSELGHGSINMDTGTCMNMGTSMSADIGVMNFCYNLDTLDSTSIIEILEPIVNLVPITTPIEFEKDDDDLGHVSWINTSANMRNTQYSIPCTTLYETRKIAGGIIPAMITTTSLVAGFQILEYIKICKLYGENKYLKWDGEKPHSDIDKYKNRFVNLNTNYCDGINPNPIKRFKTSDNDCVSEWVIFKVNSNKTREMIEQIETISKKKVEFMTWGNQTIFDGDEICVELICNSTSSTNSTNSNNSNILVLLEGIEIGFQVYLNV